ncbi:AbfB domain-containing protein [Actinoplanes sp. G11-F43]|uniref:AbfB domain-containing protein n=1 Tax=Actinoplanes sp. G11-F43 TaxID=3424130 RepID=UPI003D34BBBD
MTDQAPGPGRPAGTVYGRGGVDAGPPPPASGLPRAVPVIVGAGGVAVLLLAWVAWSSISGDKTPAVAATATGGPTTPAAAGPSATEPARPQLATGQWLLSPLDDENTYLTVSEDFAKMSPADPAPLTVVAGLDDEACFSFQLSDGRFLRHFDYRLRFDASDESDLFRADATFCQESGTEAGTIRLRSKNYPDFRVHHRGDDSLFIDKPEGDSFDGESTFMVQSP